MKFGPVPVAAAMGAVLAHSLKAGELTLKKGRVLSHADCAVLQSAGVAAITVARLEVGDVGEDEAARRIAAAIKGHSVITAEAFTGRCNLTASAPGVCVVDPARLIALNAIDEAITVATLAPYAKVTAGQMVATVKLITFAVSEASVTAVERAAGGESLISVAPFAAQSIVLIVTTLPGQKASVLEKRMRVVADRVTQLSSRLTRTHIVAHTLDAVAGALRALQDDMPDIVLVFGASAIVDRGDVIPAGLASAGGRIIHLGMPVDPGNLLMLGELGGRPVVGVPSCAASPKENGFDWVLERLVAGLPVTRASITGMAPGGLLMEIESRPQPRQPLTRHKATDAEL